MAAVTGRSASDGRPTVTGVVVAVLAAGAVAAGAATLAASFSPGRTASLVSVGCLAGLASGWTLTSSRLAPAVRIILALGLGVAALVVGAGSLDLALVVQGVVDGPRQLLTGAVPADDDALARVPAVLVCWLLTTLAVVLARRGRTAGVIVVALVALGLGTATGLADDAPRLVPALAVLVLVLATAVAARGVPRTTSAARPAPVRRPRPVGAAVIVLLAVGLGVIVASPLVDDPSTDRSTLRTLVEEPPEPTDLVNPLDVVASELAGPGAVYGTATVDPPGAARLPLATFEGYDGDTFPFGTRLGPVGDRLEGGDTPGPEATVALDLEAWPFAPLPHAGPAVAVTGPPGTRPGLGVDEQSGRLVSADGRGQWDITSRPDPAQGAQTAPLGDDAGLAPSPPLPEEFATIVAEAEAEQQRLGSTLAYVEGLASRFRTTFKVVPPEGPATQKRGGHGALVLGCLVNAGFTGEPEECASRTGTQTQVAAAFVVLLRRLGLPARLVVGFDLVPTSGRQELSTATLTAWAEVDVAGTGWVVVDPVPDTAGEVGEAGTGRSGGTDDTTPPPPEPPGPGDVVEVAAEGRALRSIVLAAVGIVVLALLVAAPALVRRRRVRRRRSGSAGSAAVGAWLEMRDRLRERGEAAPPSATVSEVIARYGGEAPSAALVNGVAFGDRPVTPAEAAALWSDVDQGSRTWRQQATLRQRLARYLRCRTPLPRRRDRRG